MRSRPRRRTRGRSILGRNIIVSRVEAARACPRFPNPRRSGPKHPWAQYTFITRGREAAARRPRFQTLPRLSQTHPVPQRHSSARLMLPGGPFTQSDEDLMAIRSDRRAEGPKTPHQHPRRSAVPPLANARKKKPNKNTEQNSVCSSSPPAGESSPRFPLRAAA